MARRACFVRPLSLFVRKNEDGTISFLTIDPTVDGFEFVVADEDRRRRLITRDAHHEYVFEEALAAKPRP